MTILKHLCITASILGAALTSQAAVLSGGIYNPATTHTYYLLDQDTWTGAEAAAQALGGDLVTINDAAENQWVFDTFSAYGGVNRTMWIGLYDSSQTNPGQTSSFSWVSGQTSSYLNFAPNEPNGFTADEFYVYMYPNGFDGVDVPRPPGTWNDYRDSSTEFGEGSPWPTTPIFAVVEVPEPASLALIGLSSLLYLPIRRRVA